MIDSDESSHLSKKKSVGKTLEKSKIKWILRNVEPGAFDEILGSQEARAGFLAGRGRAQSQQVVLIETVRRVQTRVGRHFEDRGRVTVVSGRRERRVLPPRALFANKTTLHNTFLEMASELDKLGSWAN